MNYSERLELVDLLPLSYRRELLDLNFVYNCIHKKNCINIRTYCDFYPLRNYHRNFNMQIRMVKTEQFKYFFFNRIVKLWNNLTPETKMTPYGRSGSLFKSSIRRLYLRKRLNFDVENYCTLTTFCKCALCRYR